MNQNYLNQLETIEHSVNLQSQLYSRGKDLYQKLQSIDHNDSNEVDEFFLNTKQQDMLAINLYQDHLEKQTLTSVSALSVSDGKSVASGFKTSQIAEKYITLHTKTHNVWTAKTADKYSQQISLFVELIEDIPALAIDIDVLRDKLSNVVHLIPKHSNQKKEIYFNGDIKKPIKEIIEIADQLKAERISLRTAKDIIGNIKSFLHWAESQGYVVRGTSDYLKNFSKFQKKVKIKARKFTDDELRRMFESDDYTSGKLMKKAYQYWLPLLALFTGARETELCQLHIEDISYAEKERTWTISFNDDGKKQLKNDHSKRIIPIHPALIELGFIRFYENQKRKKFTQLFPELKQDKYGHSGRKISRWFNGYDSNGRRVQGYKEKCGITKKKDEDKNFHSFRHTFMNHGKQNRLDGEVIREMCGHVSGKQDVHAVVYEDDYSLKEKLKVISKVNFNINLSVIKKWSK